MVNDNGQKYDCALPLQLSSGKDEFINESDIEIEDLLSPLEKTPCLLYTKNWWTYEVCYKRSVKQFHWERKSSKENAILLGEYSMSENNLNDLNATFVSHFFMNGSRCELFDKDRKAEIRFVCDEKATEFYIKDVTEHQSCEYRIVIPTNTLCRIPRMRTSAFKSKPSKIECYPVLNGTQLEKLHEIKEKIEVVKELKKSLVQKEDVEFVKGLKKTVSLDRLLKVMSDKMAVKLFGEVDGLLNDVVLEYGGVESNSKKSLQIIDTITTSPADESSLEDIMNLISDRNDIWIRIDDGRKSLDDLKVKLLEIEQKIFLTKLDPVNKVELESEWSDVNMNIESVNGAIIILETKANELSRKITTAKKNYKDIVDKNLSLENLEKEVILVENKEFYTSSSNGDDIVQTENIGQITIQSNFLEEDLSEGAENEHSHYLANKLAEMVKSKLVKHGVGSSNDVEVRVIAAQLPKGYEGKGNMELQNMMANIMAGNMVGYEEVDSIRINEFNYGFNWNDKQQKLQDLDRNIVKMKMDLNPEAKEQMLLYAINKDEKLKKVFGSGQQLESNNLDPDLREAVNEILKDMDEEDKESSVRPLKHENQSLEIKSNLIFESIPGDESRIRRLRGQKKKQMMKKRKENSTSQEL